VLLEMLHDASKSLNDLR
jgi:hypothetical protein